ncbi:gag-pol polyprotein [Chaetoceros tenuissimus]|uniref:Gag-pol polyprotein n=1 Tax=Chaetoceros tenuissimus TaxID=426638 RepID=A0AAD3CR50_9STRA|nr:gag-pol polyprotein [Chaetoceros tenuissimus]
MKQPKILIFGLGCLTEHCVEHGDVQSNLMNLDFILVDIILRHHTTNKKLHSRRLRKAMHAKFKDEESDEAQAWLQDKNNNRDWQEAVQKEIGALLNFHCFDIKPKGYKPPKEYQYICMHLVYYAKVDLRKKARLLCDGSCVDPRGLNTRATVVRGISVHLLDVIAHHWNKRILSGDIGNAFVQSKTKEKVYTKLVKEQGPPEYYLGNDYKFHEDFNA